jgi:hypothetical protein
VRVETNLRLPRWSPVTVAVVVGLEPHPMQEETVAATRKAAIRRTGVARRHEEVGNTNELEHER